MRRKLRLSGTIGGRPGDRRGREKQERRRGPGAPARIYNLFSGRRGSPLIKTLLVEDEPAMRRLLEDVLRSQGHDVTACPDAETAWEVFRRDAHALVVLDQIGRASCRER